MPDDPAASRETSLPQPKLPRTSSHQPSLGEANASIPTLNRTTTFRKFLAFSGPGYLVAVGYMDPGNWATGIAGGSKFGYTLLSVVLISNLMAVLLQALSARLGIVAKLDLAQACRQQYGKVTNAFLFVMAEIAIIATDLAELIGAAVAIELLFGVPLVYGVLITGFDALLILYLQRWGFRIVEALVIAMILTIGACFALELFFAQPSIAGMALGLVPTSEILFNADMLFIAMGIIGATVMPHNLYLHSAAVQTREISTTTKGIREAIKFATIDSTIALSFAFFINAAIVVVAASVFHFNGYTNVTELQEAYRLLSPLLGVAGASVLLGVALLASGINSTITATMTGQVIMEGFLRFSAPKWLIRLGTRLCALVPAVAVAVAFGDSGVAQLLILSQVILSLQLPFAIIPLVLFVSDKKLMGQFKVSYAVAGIAWIISVVIVILNIKLIYDWMTAVPT